MSLAILFHYEDPASLHFKEYYQEDMNKILKNKKGEKFGTRFVRGISRIPRTVHENPGRMGTLLHDADSNAARVKDVCLQLSVLWYPCQ